MTVEPVKEGDRFSIGEMENVSKKGVKRAEETAISAKENDVDKSRQRCKGRAEIGRTGSCTRPPPRLQPPPPSSGFVRGCGVCGCMGEGRFCGGEVPLVRLRRVRRGVWAGCEGGRGGGVR